MVLRIFCAFWCFMVVLCESKSTCPGKENGCCDNYYPVNRSCVPCPDGWFSGNCTKECPKNMYGQFCSERCPSDCNTSCHHVHGCQVTMDIGDWTVTNLSTISGNVFQDVSSSQFIYSNKERKRHIFCHLIPNTLYY